MNIYHSELLKIAASLENINPLVAYNLESQVSSLVSGPISNHFYTFAADPSLDKFKAQIKSLIDTMTVAKNELETSLTEDDAAFMAFFDNPIKEEKALEKAFDDVDKLLKTASFIVKTSSARRGKRVANFAEFFKSVKNDLLDGGSEANTFFEGADDVLKQLEEVRKNPDKELVNGIIAQLEAFIQEGNDLLNKAVEFDDTDLNPEGIGITLEGEEEANPEGVEIDFSEDEGPVDVRAVPELEGYELEKIVQHYVDVLQQALKDQDHAGINKFLKELFAETKANVEEDVAKVAARRLAQARLLPILVRFAYARPHLQPLFRPYFHVAAARMKRVRTSAVEIVKVHKSGWEESKGLFDETDKDSIQDQLNETRAQSDTKEVYVTKDGKRVAF